MNYPRATIARAMRALRCSPFDMGLFATMAAQGVSLLAIAGPTGVIQGFTHRPLSEIGAERSLLWLMEVGLLRREVDGQGLTDSFRLTPLGRLVLDRWQQQGQRRLRPSWGDRSQNFLNRWLRWPL